MHPYPMWYTPDWEIVLGMGSENCTVIQPARPRYGTIVADSTLDTADTPIVVKDVPVCRRGAKIAAAALAAALVWVAIRD